MRVTFVIADTLVTCTSIVHEGEHRPYRRRTVTIELTPEQVAALRLRDLGWSNGHPQTEEYLDCWLENEPKETT